MQHVYWNIVSDQCRSRTIVAQRRRNVLPAMADTRAIDTETREPSAREYSRHVHGIIPDRVLPGTEAMHCLFRRVPGGSHTYLL